MSDVEGDDTPAPVVDASGAMDINAAIKVQILVYFRYTVTVYEFCFKDEMLAVKIDIVLFIKIGS
jgi:hypothetical protein